MEKTAADYIKEGLELSKANQKDEALQAYDLAISKDPTNGEAYFRKAFLLDSLKQHPQIVIDLYNQAIANNYSKWTTYYNLGAKLNSMGRREEAIAAYDQSLALHQDADCYENKGNALMALGRAHEAIEAYLESLRVDPTNWTVHPRLGGLYEYIGKPEEALRYFNLCLEANPEDYRSNLRKGDLLAKMGKHEEALECFRRIDRNPEEAEPLLNYSMGAAYKAIGMEEKAIEHFGRADRMKPGNAFEFLERGRCYYMLGRKEEGSRDLRKAKELIENDKITMLLPGYVELVKKALKLMFEVENIAKEAEEAIMHLNKGDADVQQLMDTIYNLTQASEDQILRHLSNAKADEQNEHLNELIRQKEEFMKQLEAIQAKKKPVPVGKTAAEYVREGLQLAGVGKIAEAIEAYDAAIATDPTYGEAYFRKAFVMDKNKKDSEIVLDLYQKGIANGYNGWIPYYNLGAKFNSLGRREEAVEAYDRSLAIHEDADCYENKGNALMALGRLEEAVESYLKSLEVNPQNWTVHPRLGGLYEHLGQPGEAMKYFNLRLENNPEDYRSNLRKGDLLAKSGKYEEALECYKLVDHNPKVAIAQLNYSMGSAYMALGMKEKAMEHFGRAYRMKPENALDFMERGRCFYMLGNKKEALVNLRKAREFLETDKVTMLLPGYIDLIKKTLKSMMEVEDSSNKAEQAISYLNQEDPETQKLIDNMKKLQFEKEASQDQIVRRLSNVKHGQEEQEDLNELARLNEEFAKQIETINSRTEIGKSAAEYVREGLQLSNAGKKAEALQAYDLAISTDPTYGEAYFRKAFIIDSTKKDGQLVLELYQKAITNGYDGWIPYYNLGAKFNSLGRREEAIEAYNRSLAIHEDADCYENKGNALMAIGRLEEAVESYLKSLEINPQNWTVHPRLGGLYEYLGQPDKAMEYFNLRLENNPDDYRSNLRKGDLLAKSGRYEEALECYKRVDHNPKMAIAQLNYSMGSAYMALGMTEKAMEHFGRAHRMKPENALDFMERGRCFYMLGKTKEALEDLRKAKELLETDKVTMMLPGYIELVKKTLKSMLEVEDNAIRMEAAINNLDQEDPKVKKLVEDMKQLNIEKEASQGEVMRRLSNVKPGQEDEQLNELKRLNQEFAKQIEAVNNKSV